MDQWRDRYNAFRDSAAVVSERADSLDIVADSALSVADIFRDSASDLTVEVGKLNENLAQHPTLSVCFAFSLKRIGFYSGFTQEILKTDHLPSP